MAGHEKLDLLAWFACICLEVIHVAHSKNIQNEYLIYFPPALSLGDLKHI